MLSRREHRAVVLAIASFLGSSLPLEQLRAVGERAGLTDVEVDAIVAGGVPVGHELANVVATTYLVLDKLGDLDEQDRFEVRRAGIGALKLQEILQLSQIDTEVFGQS